MTLLDAPKFDEVRDRRNRRMLIGAVGLFLVAGVGAARGLAMELEHPPAWPDGGQQLPWRY